MIRVGDCQVEALREWALDVQLIALANVVEAPSRHGQMPVGADAPVALRGFRGGRPLTFGAMLRALRQRDEVPLATWATRLGITRQHLSDIERGRRAVSVERAAA